MNIFTFYAAIHPDIGFDINQVQIYSDILYSVVKWACASQNAEKYLQKSLLDEDVFIDQHIRKTSNRPW